MGYYFFYRLLSKISPTPVFIDSGDFSLLSRRVVDIINKMPENSRFLRGMRGWVGFKQRGVVYERDGRVGGEPKYTFAKLIKLAYDGIFNFSFFPIRFLTWSGVICLLSSVLYLIVTVYRKFFENDVPIGFTALLFIIIFFGGIQLISIGIIGEYVFRTFQQVKNRPMFIVKTRIEKGAIVNE
jgi:dolichol-phosphate mannosyltransferase